MENKISVETMDELNMTILKRVECPACLDYMIQPVYLCSTGHSICGQCHAVVVECPICRADLTKRRNFGLESIAELLLLPCIFVGCKDLVKSNKFDEHVFSCSFRPYSCLFDSPDGDCNWSGPRTALHEHVSTQHEKKSWMREENLDRWKEVDAIHEIQLARAHDENFYVHRVFVGNEDPINSIMYWVVQYIGPSEQTQQYAYQVQVCAEESISNIMVTEFVHSDSSTVDDIITSGQCIGIPLPILRSFKNQYDSVWYKLKIIELEKTVV